MFQITYYIQCIFWLVHLDLSLISYLYFYSRWMLWVTIIQRTYHKKKCKISMLHNTLSQVTTINSHYFPATNMVQSNPVSFSNIKCYLHLWKPGNRRNFCVSYVDTTSSLVVSSRGAHLGWQNPEWNHMVSLNIKETIKFYFHKKNIYTLIIHFTFNPHYIYLRFFLS